jgi:hypothetical protein
MRKRDEADNGGELYVHKFYRQLSSYWTTDLQTYYEAYIAMEPSWEDHASYNLSLWELSSHYDPVKSVGMRLAPLPPTSSP